MPFASKSFAKINLFLYVLGKRPDGYHEICTLFCAVNMYDTLTLYPGKDMSAPCLSCNNPDIPTGGDNVILKVHRILKEEYGLKDAYIIRLNKTIPAGAGLGGGSSNAAAYIQLVNDASCLGLSKETMADILARVSSDAPFFLYQPYAVGRGRGEILTPLPSLPKMWLVIVNPNIFVSTKDVYGDINLELTSSDLIPNITVSNPGFDELIGIMKNDLQKAVFAKHPEVARLCSFIEETGADKAMMSGSGSTVFGVFREQSGRDRAYELIRGQFPDYMVVTAKPL